MGSDFQKYLKMVFFTVHPVLYVQATFQTLYLTLFHDKFILVNLKNKLQANFIISEIFPNGL